jgi:hypothetical protein
MSAFVSCLALLTATTPVRWMDLAEPDRNEAIRQLGSKSLEGRLLEASERFLGTPYTLSPLGEGNGQDADPLIRFDAVDCVTFVEETIALSYAVDPETVEPILSELRYHHEIAFEDRNHLMEAQWLPHNVAKGFLRDVTRRYGGEDVQVVAKTLTADTWASKTSKSIGLAAGHQPTGSFKLAMIPLDRVPAVAPQIPSGTLLLVIREDRPYKPTRISHLGFLLHRGKKTYLRHATRGAAKVVDEELSSFLLRNSKYEKWKVVGVSLVEVLPRQARASISVERQSP